MADELDLVQLIARVGIAEGDVSRIESQLDALNTKIGQSGARGGASFDHGFNVPLLNAYWNIQALVNGTQDLVQILGAVSGVDIAATYQQLEVGLTTLTGSKAAADDLLKSLQQMGATTPFNTEQLVGYSRMLLATGSTAKDVVKDLGTMTDAVAALGLGTEAVGRLSVNLSQIRAGKATAADYKQFAYLGLSLDKIVGAATGRDQTGQGASTLKGMTGAQQYETILKGIDKLYGGTAAKAGGTFLGILQNLGETLQNLALPTGQLLLPVLSLLADTIKTVAGWVQRLNELTGGALGLIALFMGLYRAKNLLIGAAIMAAQKVNSLAASISGLAVSAGAATATSGAAAVGGAGAGLLATIRSGSWIRAIGPWLRGLFTVSRVANIGALLASIGLGVAGSHVGGRAGGILADAGTGIGLGSFVGSRFGPWGLAVGALVGALGGAVYGAMQKPAKGDPTQQQIARNTGMTAQSLQEMKGSSVGGGSRARLTTSQISLEMSLARMIS